MAKNRNNKNKSNQSSNMGPTSTGAMTPQEAGKLGGEKGGKAPHSCRGFECQQQQSSSSKSKNKNNR